LEEAISISLNDPKENLLRLCGVRLRQRGWDRTCGFAITAANGVCISSCDDHASRLPNCRRKEPPLSDRRFTGRVRLTVVGSTKWRKIPATPFFNKWFPIAFSDQRVFSWPVRSPTFFIQDRPAASPRLGRNRRMTKYVKLVALERVNPPPPVVRCPALGLRQFLVQEA